MKSQDIGLLLYITSMQKSEKEEGIIKNLPQNLQGWMFDGIQNQSHVDDQINEITVRYTARALEQQTGISKSQINLSLKRCYSMGLATKDPMTGVPRVNSKGLYEFVVYGLKYVFPAQPGPLTRGMVTSFGAPVLKGKLLTAGEHLLVWPDAYGNSMGLSVEPLFKTATLAAESRPEMYALLALVDAIRLGQPRESKLAVELLKEYLN